MTSFVQNSTKQEKALEKKYIKELTAFVNSEEGEIAIREAIENATKAKEALEEGTRFNPDNFYRPMTI